MKIHLTSAAATLKKIELGIAGTDHMALREFAFFHRSEMPIVDAQKLLKMLVDQHVLIQLRKYNQVSSTLTEVQQTLRDEIDSRRSEVLMPL
jgi:hypothetical protein